MDRRQLFSSLAVSPLFPLAVQQVKAPPHCPWSERAVELEDKEGPYADYAAFMEWAEENWIFTDENFGDHIDTVGVYALCCKLLRANGR